MKAARHPDMPTWQNALSRPLRGAWESGLVVAPGTSKASSLTRSPWPKHCSTPTKGKECFQLQWNPWDHLCEGGLK